MWWNSGNRPPLFLPGLPADSRGARGRHGRAGARAAHPHPEASSSMRGPQPMAPSGCITSTSRCSTQMWPPPSRCGEGPSRGWQMWLHAPGGRGTGSASRLELSTQMCGPHASDGPIRMYLADGPIRLHHPCTDAPPRCGRPHLDVGGWAHPEAHPDPHASSRCADLMHPMAPSGCFWLLRRDAASRCDRSHPDVAGPTQTVAYVTLAASLVLRLPPGCSPMGSLHTHRQQPTPPPHPCPPLPPHRPPRKEAEEGRPTCKYAAGRGGGHMGGRGLQFGRFFANG